MRGGFALGEQKVETDDRMSDPTSTRRLGVTVTPRRPGFDFEGLERRLTIRGQFQ